MSRGGISALIPIEPRKSSCCSAERWKQSSEMRRDSLPPGRPHSYPLCCPPHSEHRRRESTVCRLLLRRDGDLDVRPATHAVWTAGGRHAAGRSDDHGIDRRALGSRRSDNGVERGSQRLQLIPRSTGSARSMLACGTGRDAGRSGLYRGGVPHAGNDSYGSRIQLSFITQKRRGTLSPGHLCTPVRAVTSA